MTRLFWDLNLIIVLQDNFLNKMDAILTTKFLSIELLGIILNIMLEVIFNIKIKGTICVIYKVIQRWLVLRVTSRYYAKMLTSLSVKYQRLASLKIKQTRNFV